MKVGLLTSWLSHRGGGVMEMVRRLGTSLQSEPELQVRIFGLADAANAPSSADGKCPAISALPTRGPQAWGYAPGLTTELATFNLELLHAHGLWMYPSLASLRWAKATGRPYMITPHGMLDRWAIRNSSWKKRMALWAYEREHLGRADCLHALCESEAESIRSFGLRNPICIIPNGLELPDRRPGDGHHLNGRLPEGRELLVSLGRLHPKKNLINLLHAWHSFSQRADSGNGSWHLAIVGWDQNGHERELQSLVATLGIAGSVHFPGPLFGADKEAVLASASAFVLPSLSEGLPMVVLEAWSYGLPVLMTRHCNLPEGFRGGAALEIGTDHGAIANGLERLAAIPIDHRRGMGQNGLRLCSELYSQTTVSDKLTSVYRWLLSLGPRPACVLAD
jgi:poly(glycerol-phosphate) alpha-glucosyltransferase